MTNADATELVSYLIAAFGIGYGLGYLVVQFKKMLDLL